MKEKLFNFTVWFLLIWGAVSFTRFAIANTIKAIKAIASKVKARFKKRHSEQETVEEHFYM